MDEDESFELPSSNMISEKEEGEITSMDIENEHEEGEITQEMFDDDDGDDENNSDIVPVAELATERILQGLSTVTDPQEFILKFQDENKLSSTYDKTKNIHFYLFLYLYTFLSIFNYFSNFYLFSIFIFI